MPTAADAGPGSLGRKSQTSWWKADALADCMFLAVAIGASLMFYVGSLGFYLDDYSVLARMHASSDQSLLGVYDAVRPATGQRPLQAAIFAVLYELFGLDPLGYHVANAVLLLGVAVLFYLVLRELHLPRVVCVGTPLVYSMLPHYATERFWLNAFQISLSTAFYLLALYAGLRAVRSSATTAVAWLAVAVTATVASLLAYEVVFPLFALSLALVWWAGRRYGGDVGRGRVRLTVGILAVSIVGIGFLKTAVIAEKGQNSYGIGIEGDLWSHIGRLGWGVVAVNLGTYLVAFPRVLWWIVSNEFSILNVFIAVAIGALTFAYLRRLGVGSRTFGGRSVWTWLVGVGLVAFLLGYAIFLTTSAFLFRSAGIDNRINAAAALGLSAMLVGTLGYLAERVFPKRRAAAFAAGIACVVAGGVFVVESLGSFWTRAAERQRTILSAILADADSIPDAGILILDGACPEIGPVPVFADENDLENALKLRLRDDALAADVAAEGMHAGDGMLAIEIRSYRTETRSYPLGERLVVYDYPNRQLFSLRDEEDARRYLGERVTPTCHRQRSFAWGFDSGRPWWFR